MVHRTLAFAARSPSPAPTQLWPACRLDLRRARRVALIGTAALAVAACDQFIKQAVRDSFTLGSTHPLTSFLGVHPLVDRGFAGHQAPIGSAGVLATCGVLVATCCIVGCWPVGLQLLRYRVGLALWIGAAASNLFDRSHGGVVDYLALHLGGRAIDFNLADVALALALALVVSAVIAWQPPAPEPAAKLL